MEVCDRINMGRGRFSCCFWGIDAHSENCMGLHNMLPLLGMRTLLHAGVGEIPGPPCKSQPLGVLYWTTHQEDT